jgi:nitrite reductase/ring-hydroxylating ferredoxin subunit
MSDGMIGSCPRCHKMRPLYDGVCDHCDAELRVEMCQRYDAKYKVSTGAFLEPTCSDKDCSYCENRPTVHPGNCPNCRADKGDYGLTDALNIMRGPSHGR